MANSAEAPLPAGFTLLQVTPRLDGGGVERVTLDTARGIVSAGGRSLVATDGGVMESELIAGGSELVRLPVHSRNPIVMAANVPRLADIIRRERVSVVHVRSRAPAFSAMAAARLTGVPVVATYHGVYAARSGPKRWYNSIMTRGDLTIANSRFTRDHVLHEHKIEESRLVVAPEGVDTDRFDPARVSAERVAAIREAWGLSPDDTRPILLLAARLTGWKGQRVMVEAMSLLRGEADPLLILAGRAERPGEVDALRGLAQRLGVTRRVRIVGPVADMPAAFAAADLVVAPSTAPESFGRGVVEAAAMERPVLASPLGAPAETIVDGETGWLAPAGDAGAWAAAVDRALAQGPDVFERMGKAGRTRALALYSVERMNEAAFAIYRGLVGTVR